ELYNIDNKNDLPMAELWMGAHPKSSSAVIDEKGNTYSLREMIAEDAAAHLGATIAQRFGELPFLFKVLCAEQPLSIQVHPSKSAAEQGFAKENAAGI
ncbi:mannose-6-phosphate isomerase, partial [Pectobacterium versatile]|nr:mannose-6-phosphate isomerase [Pectobacterium versatile]